MKLKAWRQSKDLMQADIAEMIGCSQVAVSNWENGVSIPEPDKMRAIHALTEGAVTPNDFVLADA